MTGIYMTFIDMEDNENMWEKCIVLVTYITVIQSYSRENI